MKTLLLRLPTGTCTIRPIKNALVVTYITRLTCASVVTYITRLICACTIEPMRHALVVTYISHGQHDLGMYTIRFYIAPGYGIPLP